MEHPIFTSGDIHLLKLAIYILLKVNHRENRILFVGKEMTIPAGSGIFGIDQIVRDLTGLQSKKSKKYQKFRSLYYRKLQTLKNIGFLKLKPYNKFTVISIVNWEKYQAKREKCNSNVTQVKLNCNSSVTKQEVYKNVKNEKNEKETTQHLDDVVSKIFQIFKGSMKQSKIQNLIKGKDPDEMLRLAHYCSEEGENPPGLFTTMVKENAKVPKGKDKIRKIPPPPGGYQTGEEPLDQSGLDSPEEQSLPEKEPSQGQPEVEDDGLPKEKEEIDEEFSKKMREDVLKIQREIREKQKNQRP
ncbi:hypothetical protein ES705_05291 [subsurface metagenome]